MYTKQQQLKHNKKPRRKRCKQCKKLFTPTRDMQPNCSFECDMNYVNNKDNLKNLIDNGKKNRAKEINKKKREFKQNEKSKLKEKAQITFNRFIRLRDKYLPCISCGRVNNVKWNAGHFKSAGQNPNLRFNELNVHKQCEHCNMWLSGNLAEYRVNLIIKIGLENVEALERDKSVKKYSIDDYKNIISEYNLKIKELENV